MKASEHIKGGLVGIGVGPAVTVTAAYIAVSLFWKGGGFVIDFGPALILIYAVIWGAFSGAVIGVLLLRPIQAVLVCIALVLFAYLFLFLANVAEKGFEKTFSIWSNENVFFNTGALCFLTITILSGITVASVNQLFSNQNRER